MSQMKVRIRPEEREALRYFIKLTKRAGADRSCIAAAVWRQRRRIIEQRLGRITGIAVEAMS